MTASFDWTAWLFWVGGGFVALAGVCLLLWSLWWNRSRGRKRCPTCWYDLGGITSNEIVRFPLTCSECGTTIKRHRKLFKTRRRWRYAMVGCLVAVLGYSILVTPRVRLVGWVGAVPTSLLIAVHPWRDTMDAPSDAALEDLLSSELLRRISSGRGWKWQRRWIARRCADTLLHGGVSNLDSMNSADSRTILAALDSDAWFALPELLVGYRNDDPRVRASALYEIHQLKLYDKVVASCAAKAVGDEDEIVRRFGGWILLDLAKHDDPEIRRIASEAPKTR